MSNRATSTTPHNSRLATFWLDVDYTRIAPALLARDLRAEAAIGIGLGTTEEARAVAREIGLRTKPTIAHRVRWAAVGWTRRG